MVTTEALLFGDRPSKSVSLVVTYAAITMTALVGAAFAGTVSPDSPVTTLLRQDLLSVVLFAAPGLIALGGADPDMAAVEALSEEHDVAGIYAFTFDALESDSTLHGRMWAPAAGVPEDPVTGTASGACGAYLRESGAFDEFPEEMRFEQGHFVDRPGYVRVRVDGDEVRVGGEATTTLEGELAVPPADEDGIIEA